jgi:hypothetical protein
VLTGQPDNSPKRTVFSLVVGSHTHYLAAETLQEAQQWVSAVRECWLHCFSHTARSTAAVGGSSGAVVSQRLLAENAQLRESIQELHQKVAETDSEYWRCGTRGCLVAVTPCDCATGWRLLEQRIHCCHQTRAEADISKKS